MLPKVDYVLITSLFLMRGDAMRRRSVSFARRAGKMFISASNEPSAC